MHLPMYDINGYSQQLYTILHLSTVYSYVAAKVIHEKQTNFVVLHTETSFDSKTIPFHILTHWIDTHRIYSNVATPQTINLWTN